MVPYKLRKLIQGALRKFKFPNDKDIAFIQAGLDMNQFHIDYTIRSLRYELRSKGFLVGADYGPKTRGHSER